MDSLRLLPVMSQALSLEGIPSKKSTSFPCQENTIVLCAFLERLSTFIKWPLIGRVEHLYRLRIGCMSLPQAAS
ncbi:hypothetical protein D3C87_1926070 [compost metagenome]